jgi:hypothetical protein
MNHLAELHAMIDRVLSGEWKFAEFDRTFGIYYDDNLPVDIMRSSAAAFVSAVLEKLEFTTDSPSADERANEWLDPQDFLAWLRHERSRMTTDAAGSTSRPAV